MPTAKHIVRIRRRRGRSGPEWPSGRLILLGIALVFFLGAAGPMSAVAYGELTRDLPLIETIEHSFGPEGLFLPVRMVDRSGTHLLYEALNPRAKDRRPYIVEAMPAGVGLAYPEAAAIAAESRPLLIGPGADVNRLVPLGLGGQEPATESAMKSIARRLTENLLQPLGDARRPAIVRATRTNLLAGDVSARYSSKQLLTWYLNSAPFGRSVFGIDAAALVFFGKHAAELSLAETAILAAVAADPGLDPLTAPSIARDGQVEVLRRMAELGFVTGAQAVSALAAPINLASANGEPALGVPAFVEYVWDSLDRLMGPGGAAHGGLEIITTIDYDLQLQAACAAATHLARMGGGDPGGMEPAADGSACLAGGLLPPLRPSDSGVDHGLEESAVVILDPTHGQILSFVGPATAPKPAGDVFTPFIFLTAFARGYTPATMIVDVLPTDSQAITGSSEHEAGTVALFHGPVRMRTALANSYTAATVETVKLVGVDGVARTAHQMGLEAFDDPSAEPGPAQLVEEVEGSLADLTYAFGVLAVQGRMVGVPKPASDQRQGFRSLDPVIIVRVEDASGEVIYGMQLSERSVVSPQLAYLMADVLSDEAARALSFGQPNSLEVGRPAAVKTGLPSDGRGAWAVGFTPRLAVGVWVGTEEAEGLTGVEARNGAAPIWHALMRYASRDVDSEAWPLPPGVSEIDVCDPSGLLPTAYCPHVVSEVFPQGTEPTHYDNLYQPYRVNRETGKLATLFTPIDLVEEHVYLIPPVEAADWARQAGLPQPPEEYDTLYEAPPAAPGVQITSPASFDYLRGKIGVFGDANPEDFDYYRLQYGAGLNPTRWFQIGQDAARPVDRGRLGEWDTAGLSGLYTLQLVVVRAGGQVSTAAAPVTIDNRPPTVQIVLPTPGEVFSLAETDSLSIQAEASDDLTLARLVFYVDGRTLATVASPPYSTRWDVTTVGTHILFVRAYDVAGNWSESEHITIEVQR